MKNQTELPKNITLESIADHISIGDIPEFRDNLREMMDGYFLYCADPGFANPAPAWCAFRAVDSLLEMIYEHKQSQLPISKSQTITSN
jgi:hypothetical protein